MRKLATVREITALRPIEGADAIECAVVGGWTVVVKKGEYEVGDHAIYCEIDSWIPHELAPFLSKGTEPREYNGVKGERLKTIKLRGQLSQGLLLPTHIAEWKIAPGEPYNLELDSDVTDVLKIQKWEAPIPAQLAGQIRGNFPTAVPKTDQERIQNLVREFEEYKDEKLHFEITEKLDGSSCTFYLPIEGDFEVCSRNLSLKEDPNNSFWKVAIQYQVKDRMVLAGLEGHAIQGELVGEGIQKNPYKIKGQDFYVYDIYNVRTGMYLNAEERAKIAKLLGLKHVPVISETMLINKNVDVQNILKLAEGKSVLNNKAEREGIVFKCVEEPEVSFKAISNKFLLKGGE